MEEQKEQMTDPKVSLLQDEESEDSTEFGPVRLAVVLTILVTAVLIGYAVTFFNNSGNEPAVSSENEAGSAELTPEATEAPEPQVPKERVLVDILGFGAEDTEQILVNANTGLELYFLNEGVECDTECGEGMVPYVVSEEFVDSYHEQLKTILDEESGNYQVTWNGRLLYYYDAELSTEESIPAMSREEWELAKPN